MIVSLTSVTTPKIQLFMLPILRSYTLFWCVSEKQESGNGCVSILPRGLCVCVCVYVFAWVCVHVCLSVCAWLPECVCMSAWVCVHVCLSVCACLCLIVYYLVIRIPIIFSRSSSYSSWVLQKHYKHDTDSLIDKESHTHLKYNHIQATQLKWSLCVCVPSQSPLFHEMLFKGYFAVCWVNGYGR